MHDVGSIYICFNPIWVLGGWVGGAVSQEAGMQPACAIFHRGQLKNQSFRNLFFFDIVTTHNEHPSYVKHDLGSICVFFLPYLGP